MTNYNLIRQVDVFEKKTERLNSEIVLDSFDLEVMKLRFVISPKDPMMFNPYLIDKTNIDLFPNIEFDFENYDYYLACYNDSNNKVK